MIDFLYTRKPLIKTSNYHESCDIVSELGWAGQLKRLKGNPQQDMRRIKFENFSCTLNNSDLKYVQQKQTAT